MEILRKVLTFEAQWLAHATLSGFTNCGGDGELKYDALCWAYLQNKFPRELVSLNQYEKGKSIAHYLQKKDWLGSDEQSLLTQIAGITDFGNTEFNQQNIILNLNVLCTVLDSAEFDEVIPVMRLKLMFCEIVKFMVPTGNFVKGNTLVQRRQIPWLLRSEAEPRLRILQTGMSDAVVFKKKDLAKAKAVPKKPKKEPKSKARKIVENTSPNTPPPKETRPASSDHAGSESKDNATIPGKEMIEKKWLHDLYFSVEEHLGENGDNYENDSDAMDQSSGLDSTKDSTPWSFAPEEALLLTMKTSRIGRSCGNA